MRFSVCKAIEFQMDSITESEATRNFEISCELCCRNGFKMECKHCPVKSAYEQKCAAILDLRIIEAERERKRNEEKAQKGEITCQ